MSDWDALRKQELMNIYNYIFALAGISKGCKVLDIGAGKTTEYLLNTGAEVVCLDTDREKLEALRNSKAKIVLGDVTSLPFIAKYFDLCVIGFVMHKIDPRLHAQVVKEMKRTSKAVLIIEKEPGFDALQREYDTVWENAMRSIGRFEVYRDINYWAGLIELLHPTTLKKRVYPRMAGISPKKADEFFTHLKNKWEGMGVSEEHIQHLDAIAEKVMAGGMRAHSILAVYAEFGESDGC